MNSSQLVIESLVRNIIVRLLESSGTHKNTWVEIVLNTPDHISTFLSSLLTINPRISRDQPRLRVFPALGLIIIITIIMSIDTSWRMSGSWDTRDIVTWHMTTSWHMTHNTWHMTHDHSSVRLIVSPRYSGPQPHHDTMGKFKLNCQAQFWWLQFIIITKALQMSIQVTTRAVYFCMVLSAPYKVLLIVVKIKTRLQPLSDSHWLIAASYSRSPQSDFQNLDYVRNSAKNFFRPEVINISKDLLPIVSALFCWFMIFFYTL